MRSDSYLGRWFGSLTVVIRGMACLTVCGAMTMAAEVAEKPAGSFEIPAWAFDRGNARVDANPSPTSTVVTEKSFFRKYFGPKLGPWTDVVCLASHCLSELRCIKS
jgi:hypothetical protein